jgi:hypothetical protein
VLLQNAPDQVGDAQKVFEQYWSLAETAKLPSSWPARCDSSAPPASPPPR